jgi:hypothetical protein
LSLSEPVRLRYAVRYVNASNQRASFSNFLLIEPAPSVSQPPVLDAEPEVTQDAVTLRWQPPSVNVDGSTPANLLGYNVYRAARAQNEPAQTPLNSAPLNANANRFSDQTFSFGEEYVYLVRAVSLGTGGAPVESLNSNAVVIKPLDTFPPTAPSKPTAAATSSPLRVSLFFAANPERDVNGYNVYRTEDASLPRDGWTKLNRAPLERNTFQDEDVRRGAKYFYYVTAVDNAGNESAPSEVTSDTVP